MSTRYNVRNTNYYKQNISTNNTIHSNYHTVVVGKNKNTDNIVVGVQHKPDDNYRCIVFSSFIKHIKQRFNIHGISFDYMTSGGGGWIYRMVVSDVGGIIPGIDTSLQANKQRWYDFMTTKTTRKVPRSNASMIVSQFILKIQVTTNQPNINKIKENELNQIREDHIAHFLSSSPLSKPYVPKFFMGGTYKFDTHILRLSCMEMIKGYQLGALLQYDAPLPRSIIPKFEKACMSLWAQGLHHGDLEYGTNVLVQLQPSVRVYLIDYGQTKQYNNNTAPKNISDMRRLIRRLENHK